MTPDPLLLAYDRATVVVSGGPPGFDYTALPGVLFDPRTSLYRAQGRHYRAVAQHLVREKIPYTDEARGWENKPAGWTLANDRTPHPHQAEALAAWWRAGGRGVVVLPTGTGKTFAAMPTLDLMRQWHTDLSNRFGVEVGAVGGGDYSFHPITVTTYDSAYIHLERWANKYGLVIFDECHHLPGPTYSQTAVGSLAPYRLGLTATPERADGSPRTRPASSPSICRRKKRKSTALAGRSTGGSWRSGASACPGRTAGRSSCSRRAGRRRGGRRCGRSAGRRPSSAGPAGSSQHSKS
jgi:hypothetical protein